MAFTPKQEKFLEAARRYKEQSERKEQQLIQRLLAANANAFLFSLEELQQPLEEQLIARGLDGCEWGFEGDKPQPDDATAVTTAVRLLDGTLFPFVRVPLELPGVTNPTTWRLLLLAHELGHADDLRNGYAGKPSSFDFEAYTFDRVAAEVYAHQFTLHLMESEKLPWANKAYVEQLNRHMSQPNESMRASATQCLQSDLALRYSS